MLVCDNREGSRNCVLRRSLCLQRLVKREDWVDEDIELVQSRATAAMEEFIQKLGIEPETWFLYVVRRKIESVIHEEQLPRDELSWRLYYGDNAFSHGQRG